MSSPTLDFFLYIFLDVVTDNEIAENMIKPIHHFCSVLLAFFLHLGMTWRQ